MELESLGRSCHRRVTTLTFSINPKRYKTVIEMRPRTRARSLLFKVQRVYMVQARSLHILGRTSGERESTLAAVACRLNLRAHTAALFQRKTFPKNHSRN